MASQSEIDTRKAILRARGVPEAFIDNIANREGYTLQTLSPYLWSSAILLSVLLLWLFLPKIVSPLILPYLYADELKSPLFYSPTVSKEDLILVLLFAFSIFAIILSRRDSLSRAKPYPAYHPHAIVLRNHPKLQPLSSIKPEAHFADLTHVADDAAFLMAAQKASLPNALFYNWVFFLVFACFSFSLISDLSEYQRVSMDSVQVRKDFKTETYRFHDAKHVDVLCFNYRRSVELRYQLVYTGETVDIWERNDYLHNLEPEGVMDRLMLIDKQLTKLGVPINRLPRNGNLGVEGKACVEHAAKLWGLKNTDKLNRLVFGS